MSQIRPVALALIASVALFAAGCGSSKSTTTQAAASTETATSPTTSTASTTSTSPVSSGPLTKAALIAKADEICQRMNAKRAAIKVTTTEDLRVYVPLSKEEKAEIAELSKLTPPSSLASDWHVIIAANQTIAEKTGQLGEYAQTNNKLGTGSRVLIVSAEQAEALLRTTASHDGFRECATLS